MLQLFYEKGSRLPKIKWVVGQSLKFPFRSHITILRTHELLEGVWKNISYYNGLWSCKGPHYINKYTVDLLYQSFTGGGWSGEKRLKRLLKGDINTKKGWEALCQSHFVGSSFSFMKTLFQTSHKKSWTLGCRCDTLCGVINRIPLQIGSNQEARFDLIL